MSEIYFNPDTHVYTRSDGSTVPGVTGALKDLGIIDTTYYTKEGTARGTAVHEATRLIDCGDLNVADFAEHVAYPYLQAWNAYKAATKLEVVEAEVVHYESTFRYASSVDRIVTMDHAQVIIDIKTGSLQPWHGLQLAAYSLLTGVERRVIVELRDDATFRVHTEWKDRKFSARLWDRWWQAAITSYWLKRDLAA